MWSWFKRKPEPPIEQSKPQTKSQIDFSPKFLFETDFITGNIKITFDWPNPELNADAQRLTQLVSNTLTFLQTGQLEKLIESAIDDNSLRNGGADIGSVVKTLVSDNLSVFQKALAETLRERVSMTPSEVFQRKNLEGNSKG